MVAEKKKKIQKTEVKLNCLSTLMVAWFWGLVLVF